MEQSSDITLIGQSVECETVDVSCSGIGILLDRFVPTESNVKVIISSLEFPLVRVFNLVGETRWVKEVDQGCQTGIRFQQTDDFDSWEKGFQKRITPNG